MLPTCFFLKKKLYQHFVEVFFRLQTYQSILKKTTTKKNIFVLTFPDKATMYYRNKEFLKNVYIYSKVPLKFNLALSITISYYAATKNYF